MDDKGEHQLKLILKKIKVYILEGLVNNKINSVTDIDSRY